MTLSAEEFLRRFVQHVLPRGFAKARHYGFLANRYRAEKLKVCRRLQLPLTATTAATPTASDEKIAASPMPQCPQCGGGRLLHLELPQEVPASVMGNADSS